MITVVTLVLHSTQAVYRTISSIKHAPQTLSKLVSNLRNLSNVLQELSGFGDDLYLASDLPRLVSKLAEYMKAFEGKLCGLYSPIDKPVARLWKNVKVAIQETEIDRMSALLYQDVEALSIQLSIIKRSVSSIRLL